jgi:acyl carrier protein
VQRVLVEALGADHDDVTPGARLQEDLGAESIDFLDIVFRLEREFGIKIPRGELFPDSVFGDHPELVSGGLVSNAGMDLLRSRMPYANLSALDRSRRLDGIGDLFTVELIVRYVGWKLAGGDTSRGALTPGFAEHAPVVASGPPASSSN